MGLERECPSCHRVNRPGSRSCDGCGFDFITGRPGRSRPDTEGKSHPGVVGLALGTIAHPVSTMDSFFYYVSDTVMLRRMAIFYFISLPIAGFIMSAGHEGVSWVQGTFAELAGFAVSTICIIAAGRLLGQSGGLMSAAVILGFARAVVTCVGGVYVLAVVMGLMDPNFIVIIVFMAWSIVLNLMALTNIFGCSAGVAFFISIIAGILHSIVSRAVGVPA
jgi:hypothetical protein